MVVVVVIVVVMMIIITSQLHTKCISRMDPLRQVDVR